jgi:hypothetical protein
MKKAAALFVAIIYLQVNVAWAGVPSQFPFSLLHLQLSKAKDDVLLFHWRPDELRTPANFEPRGTTPDKVEQPQPEPLKPGRHDSSNDTKPAETKGAAAPTAEVMVKSVENKPNVEVAQAVVSFAIQTVGIEQGDQLSGRVDQLMANMAKDGFDSSTSLELREINQTLAPTGVQLNVTPSANGTLKLEVVKAEAGSVPPAEAGKAASELPGASTTDKAVRAINSADASIS